MIQIKKIEIEGFCSIVEPFSYVFDSPGINLIWGRNGSGKSTIFNALAWCLYGKLLKPKRSITPWKSLQTKKFDGTRVEVILYTEDSRVRITRWKDYLGKSGVNLSMMGNVYPARKKAETEKEIEKVLGVSFELFKASITFGQNLSRFLKLPSTNQKEILDEAFSINYINEAKEKAKKEREVLANDLFARSEDSNKLSSEVNNLNENIKEMELLKKNFDTDKNKKLRDIRSELKALRLKIFDWKRELDKKKIIANEIKTQKSILGNLGEEVLAMELLDDEIFKEDFGTSNDAAELLGFKTKRKELMITIGKPTLTCFTCGQTINRDQKEKQKKELKAKIESLGMNILELETSLAKRIKELNKMRIKQKSKLEVKKKVDEANKRLKDANDNLIRLESVSENLGLAIKNKNQLITKLRETLLQKFSYNLDTKRKKLIDLKAKKSMVDFKCQRLKKEIKLHDWVISDPLSNKGIKAYIFNLMIQKINIRLQEYGKKIGFGIKLSIDLESANKTFNAQITRLNQVVSYDDLSGGEEQLIDVCLSFAMHDVISNNRFNILLLDEVFESLDKDNIDLIYEIIDFKSRSTAVHLISHRQSFVSRATAVMKL